jgi:nicotinate-nucleotide pyrophosphorylase (carboxylating)
MESSLLEQSISSLITLALEEDLGKSGDLTSVPILGKTQLISGQIIAKQAGVIAGLSVLSAVYQRIDANVHITCHVQDGDHVATKQLLCDVHGPGTSILSGERIALNFLQHLSGVATLTAQFVEAIKGTGATILDTRKTTPGWRALEKYAVRMGGGQNHRMGLFDMVLIKDNHIDAAGGITEAVTKIRQHQEAKKLDIVVEARTLDEVKEALAANVQQILLDNMTIEEMAEAVLIINHQCKVEASGNMSLERVKEVAEAGVDFISVGMLTHSAPAMDLSMKLKLA